MVASHHPGRLIKPGRARCGRHRRCPAGRQRRRTGEIGQGGRERLRRPRVRKKSVEASREAQHREIEATFQEVIRGQLGGDAAGISTDPAAAGDDRTVDRKAGRTRYGDRLIVGRTSRIADRPVRRLRSRLGIAVPLVERVRRGAAATREVDRNQEVAFRPVADKVARTAGSEPDDRL